MVRAEAKFKRVKTDLKTEIQLVFSTTDELDEMQLAQMEGKKGHLVFALDEITAKVEELMKARRVEVDRDGRSKSQIMRGEIFEVWQSKFRERFPEFNDFYAAWMDKLIGEIKAAK